MLASSRQQSMPQFVSWLSETFSLPARVAVAAESVFQDLDTVSETGSKVLLSNEVAYQVYFQLWPHFDKW